MTFHVMRFGSHHSAVLAGLRLNSAWLLASADFERGLYSPPGIPPGIPLESRNSAGLILEFDILPDCGQNITGMVFHLLCLMSPYRVPLDSVKFL